MRKFLLPIINIVNVILVSISFGLLSKSAASIENPTATWPKFYEMPWTSAETNVVGIVGFFLFVFGAAFTLFCFLPVKARKFVVLVAGAMYIAAGVLVLRTPYHYIPKFNAANIELSGALIASAVLMFVVGAFSLLMSLIEFTEKEDK